MFVIVLLVAFIVILFGIRPVVNFFAPYEIDEIDYTDIEGDVIIEDGIVYINKTLQWTYTDQFNYGSEGFVNTSISDGIDIELDIIGDPIESNVPFTTPSNYDYNPTNVVVSGGVAKLNIIEGSEKNYPLTTPANYTYDGSKIEVAGGVAKLFGSDLTENLEGYWKMDEAVWNGIPEEVIDSSNNTNNGRAVNDADTEAGGIIGRAGAFDSIGTESVAIPHHATLEFESTDAFTYQTWVQCSPSITYRSIMSMQNVSTAVGINLQITSSDKIRFNMVGATGSLAVESTNTIADGEYHHIIVTYDGSGDSDGVHIYIDNNDENLFIVADSLSGSIGNIVPFQLANREKGDQAYDGYLDEVAVWSKELTSSAVASLYNLGAGLEITYYSLDNPNITANTGYVFSTMLETFTETATKPNGTNIKYQISSNDGTTWKWWNGTAWDNITGGQTDTWYYANETNLASVIDTNIFDLASSGSFKFRAFLHTDDGIITPELSNIYANEGVTYPLGYHLITMDYDIEPVSVLNWLNLTETVSKPTGTDITYTYSIDGGSSYNNTWFTEPELEIAVQNIITISDGSDKIRFRFNLSTTDDIETPIIDNLNIFNEQGYTPNGTYMCGEFTISTYRYIIWKTISIDITTPNGTTLKIYTATSGGVLSPEGQWALRNDGDVLNVPASPEGIFFQWYSEFTAIGKYTPTLHSIEINYWEFVLHLN